MARRPVDTQALLAALPLFKALAPSTLARLASAATRRSLARGERVFSKGDPAIAMYLVVHGEVRLLVRRPAQGERLVGVVGPGQSFGEPVMFLERAAVVDAEAAGDALVLQLPREAVFCEIDRDPRFARRIIASLAQRAQSLVQELERQALGQGRARLVHYLVHRAGEGPGPRVFILPATKAAVAAQLRLTPEHFSRLLHDMVAAGLLEVHGRHITVPDVRRLRASAGKLPRTPPSAA
jgi:CRP-like cAMP-binding protein